MENKNMPTVLGVGNALIDVISILENDDILKKFKLPRGSMTLVDAALSKKIYDATSASKSELTTGGSVANTMRSLASLGGKGGYLGKTGKDDLGKLFKDDFEKRGLKTHLIESGTETGRVMGLVSPDSERTMATYLGAAAEMTPDEISPDVFKGYTWFYIEGYLVFNQQLIEACGKAAHKAGVKVAIDLSSFNVVEANLEFLKTFIHKYVDIVFANEEEAKSFTGKEPEEAINELAKTCEIAVVKIGKDGSMIKKGNDITLIGIIPAKAIDTTGAGDAYAAGFFYGLTHGYNMKITGEIAALVSGKVVEVMGPNLAENAWPDVHKQIEEIVRNNA
jgi:sugar/nucleoside kinase (ribokinase family)